MINFDTECYVPARCDSCHDIISADIMNTPATCPQCDGGVTFIVEPLDSQTPTEEIPIDGWVLPDDRILVVDPGPYPCPRCDTMTLHLPVTGMFD